MSKQKNTKTTSNNGITWIDISKPTEENVAELRDQINLHPFIAKQIIPPIHRQEIEEYKSQLFMLLRFPIYNEEAKHSEPIELDIIITPDTLITIHDKEITPLRVFFNDCDLQDYHKKQYFKSSGHLIFSLLDFMLDSCLPMLDHIHEKIEYIESEVFKQSREKEMLYEITHLKRDITDFRRAIKPQRPVLEILAKKSKYFFDKNLDSLSQEVIGSNIRVWNILEYHKELIFTIVHTYNTLLS